MTHKLYQHSTIGALMSGLFQGSLSFEELLEQGDFGIGTIHALDGELVILGGKPYVIKVDGSVALVQVDESTPYAMVTHFKPDHSMQIAKELTGHELEKNLSTSFSSGNIFQAVKIQGTFKDIICRSVAKQEEPYARLSEVAADQAEFTRAEVQGTLVGFYTPEIFGTVAVAGFHFHFMSDEKDFGGHVLEYKCVEGRAEWMAIETLEQHFPIHNKTFMENDIDYANLAAEIEAIE